MKRIATPSLPFNPSALLVVALRAQHFPNDDRRSQKPSASTTTKYSDIQGKVDDIIRQAKFAAGSRDVMEERELGMVDGRTRRPSSLHAALPRPPVDFGGEDTQDQFEDSPQVGRSYIPTGKGIRRPVARHAGEGLVDPKTGMPAAEEPLPYKDRVGRVMASDIQREEEEEAAAPSRWSGSVDVFDCYENKVRPDDIYAAGGQFETFKQLGSTVLPKSTGSKVVSAASNSRWSEPTALQKLAIPVLLQGRDACIVGPTGTGKTAAYLIPLIARVAAKLEGTEATGAALRAATQSGIANGEVCKHCELDMASNPVCPMTGKFHQRSPKSMDVFDEANASDVTEPALMSELPSVTEPIGIVVVPTTALVQQTYRVAMGLSPQHVRVGYLCRSSDEFEGKRMMKAFHGCNLLVSTPDHIASAINRRKLSVRSVRSVAFDEMATLLQTQAFETLKVMLGGLPRGDARPQRVFVGSSFPKDIRIPMRTSLLHKNQRIIIASGDSVMNTTSRRTQMRGSSEASSLDIAADPIGNVASVNPSTSHTVFMLSRLEKIDKLKWLYDTVKLTADQRVIIFCNSGAAVTYIIEQLRDFMARQYNINMTQLHGKMSPQGQQAAIQALKSGASTCLVCTDVSSTGIDFTNVTYVVNFDMPPLFETWINRVGRCGRMGKKGYTFNFFCPENIRLAAPLARHLKRCYGRQVIPPKLLEYASKDYNELFASKNFYDVNKHKAPRREEAFTNLTNTGPARYAHFGHSASDANKFRRPET